MLTAPLIYTFLPLTTRTPIYQVGLSLSQNLPWSPPEPGPGVGGGRSRSDHNIIPLPESCRS